MTYLDSLESKKHKKSEELQEIVEEARELAGELGLDPRPVNYWIVDHEEMNQVVAYDGFQERYPHWRWGMKYEQYRKRSQHGMARAFELVNNDDPANAFLQVSNSDIQQKAVIAHVEAHSDFFKNNKWFKENPRAADMLSRHAESIEKYMNDPDISQEDVEQWIDYIHSLQDNINQYSSYFFRDMRENSDDEFEEVDLRERIEGLGVSDHIADAIFDNDDDKVDKQQMLEEHEKDILAYLMKNGKQNVRGVAVDFEDWQVDIIDMMREEFYYFAPNKMTKIMNEGWASYWESLMLTSESLATSEEILDYSEMHSQIIQSNQFNPYRLGKQLWEHIENTTNREEVVDKLLRVDGIDPVNFHRDIDFDRLNDLLDHRDSDDIVKRNFSLTRIENQGFIQNIPMSKLYEINRYIMDMDRYASIEEAIEDVDYEAGWRRMREVRETHNDVMFLDEFLTQEFVDDQRYYTYEYRIPHDQHEIASRDVEDVRRKLLLQFTNFGKPWIEVASGNFDNDGTLLLIHKYNGIAMDADEAIDTMKHIFEMWGRDVSLATVMKGVEQSELDFALSENKTPDIEEIPVLLSYDGEEERVSEVGDIPSMWRDEIEDRIFAKDVDYDTRPDRWK